MSRQNQARVTVAVDGVVLGVWEDREGGDTDSSDTTYRLGGMGPRISLGGSVAVDNVIARCLFDDDRRSRAKWLLGRVGKGRFVLTEQPLDVEGAADGEPFVWRGTLKRVALPERGADSDDAAQLEVEATISGPVS